MKKKFSAVSSLLILLLVMTACVQKPQEEVTPEWEGKEDFTVSEKGNEELEARYEEYRENHGLAFGSVEVEDEALFECEAYEDGVKIVAYSGDSTIISVPENIGGKKVLALGAETFAENKNLRAVSLPEGILEIEKGAFAGCESLATLKIPFVGDGKENGIFGVIFGAESYDKQAITIPATLDMVIVTGGEEIVDNAFVGCKNVSAIALPVSIKKIGEFAFYECRDLVYLSLVSNEFSVGKYAFAYCSSLYSVSLGNAVEIGFGAFYECESLERAELPFVGGSADENRYIGYIFGAENADYNDEFVPASLRNVSVVKCSSIPDRAFAGCTYIYEVKIADSVTEIGIRAFYSCRSLKNIIIPDSIKSLGDDSFFGCDNLESVELGTGVESIGMQSFYGCQKLKTIVIPEKVAEIKASTFSMCESLETVTLNNVKKVGKDAFYGCDALNPVDCSGIEVADGNHKLTGSSSEEE